MKNSTDPIFNDPRLTVIYDAFDGARNDLPPYVKIIDDLQADSVIDLGCGTGVLSLLLAKKGKRVIGVDPARASIETARSKTNADSVEWIVGDATSLPEGVAADIVVMTGNVAQAIVDPDQWEITLARAHSALKTDGHLVFETRNPQYKAWEDWNKKESFQSIEVPGMGVVDGWVEVTSVSLPLVSFRWTYFFHQDGVTLTSDSTLRFRSLEEITASLRDHNFVINEVREAPDRPGKEYVVIAQKLTSQRSRMST